MSFIESFKDVEIKNGNDKKVGFFHHKLAKAYKFQ